MKNFLWFIALAVIFMLLWCFVFPEKQTPWEQQLESQKAVQEWMERHPHRRLVP